MEMDGLKKFGEPLPCEHTSVQELRRPLFLESLPLPCEHTSVQELRRPLFLESLPLPSVGSASSSSTSRASTSTLNPSPCYVQESAAVEQQSAHTAVDIGNVAESVSLGDIEDNDGPSKDQPSQNLGGVRQRIQELVSSASIHKHQSVQRDVGPNAEGKIIPIGDNTSLAPQKEPDMQASLLCTFSVGQDHQEAKSDEGGKYSCLFPGCSNTSGFSRQADLKRHLIIHTGDEPWQCGCCENLGKPKPYRGKRKDNLIQHLRKTHHASSYRECTVCPRSPDFGTFFSGSGCVEVHHQQRHRVRDDDESVAQGLTGDAMLIDGDYATTIPKPFEGCEGCKACKPQDIQDGNPDGPIPAFFLGIPEPIKQAKLFDSQSCTARAPETSPTRRRHVSTPVDGDSSSQAPLGQQLVAPSLARHASFHQTSSLHQAQRPTFTHWYCGNCPDPQPMALNLHECCVSCGSRRSTYARYVSMQNMAPTPNSQWRPTVGDPETPKTFRGTPEAITRVPLAVFLMVIDAVLKVGLDLASNPQSSQGASFLERGTGRTVPTTSGTHLGTTFQMPGTSVPPPEGNRTKIRADTMISYDSRERAIKFHGATTVSLKAKARIQALLADFAARSGHFVLEHCVPRPILPSPRFLLGFRPKQRKSVATGPRKLFPLSVRHDSALIRTWHESVIPALPGLLKERVGHNYTASLMREGKSRARAKACVRIVISSWCSKEIRETIKKAIQSMFAGLTVLVRFSEGGLRLLMGGGGRDDIDVEDAEQYSLVESSDEDEVEPHDFPYHQQYWHRPGAGASIGLLNTRKVSATLGGYVYVQQDPRTRGEIYALIVKHVIDASRIQADRPKSDDSDKDTLVSPSLSDVYSLKKDLQQELRNVVAETSRYQDACDQHGSVDEWYQSASLGTQLGELRAKQYQLRALLQEVERSDWDYELGKVSLQCPSNVRQALGSRYEPGTLGHCGGAGKPIHMDWAICLVKADRAGKTRHRFRYDEENKVINTPQPDPTGSGSLFQETDDLEPGAEVYYVGRKSGKREGIVNVTREAVDWEGFQTEEWTFLCSNGEMLEEAACKGDSGAFIIRKCDHKVCGQLYGWQRGKLVISPINDVFADIKQHLGAHRVSLPRYRQFSQPVDPLRTAEGFLPICEVKDGPAKPQRIKMSTLPPVATYKVATQEPFVTPWRPAISGGAATSRQDPTRSPSRTTATEEPRRCTPPSSPAPSLVSASSSSSKPSSAHSLRSMPEDPPTPRPLPSLKFSTSNPTIGEDIGATEKPTLLSMALCQEPSIDAAREEWVDKTSLSFILNKPTSLVGSGLQGQKTVSFTGLRHKSATFPLRKTQADSLTYSWDDGALRLTRNMVANAGAQI